MSKVVGKSSFQEVQELKCESYVKFLSILLVESILRAGYADLKSVANF